MIYKKLLYDMWLGVCLILFFFKQKTAYEMRISYWSSDVCSSDLIRQCPPGPLRDQRGGDGALRGHARDGAPFHQRGPYPRDRVHPQCDGIDQSRRLQERKSVV